MYSDLIKAFDTWTYIYTRPTLYNIIILSILNDFQKARVLSSPFYPTGIDFDECKGGAKLNLDVMSCNDVSLIIIHVHITTFAQVI